jgi:mono/diheme cytochrome c family protein
MKTRALFVVTTLFGLATSASAVEPAGHLVFQKWCAPCHAPGPNHPGTAALEVLYNKTRPGALEQRTDLTDAAIRLAVRQGAFSMPFFRKTEISDADLHALVEYLVKPTK